MVTIILDALPICGCCAYGTRTTEITMRIIEIAAMLLFAASVPASAGPAPVAPPPVPSNVVSAADDRPSSEAVISALAAFWEGRDDRKLADLKERRRESLALRERHQNQNKYNKYCSPEAMAADVNGGFARERASGRYGPGMTSCDVNEYAKMDQDNVDRDRSAVQNFARDFEPDKAVLTVAKTDNYEGNIISYVGLRLEGGGKGRPLQGVFKTGRRRAHGGEDGASGMRATPAGSRRSEEWPSCSASSI